MRSAAEHPWLERWRELLEPYLAGALDFGVEGRLDLAQRPASRRRAGAVRRAPQRAGSFEFRGRSRAKLLGDLDRLAAFLEVGAR